MRVEFAFWKLQKRQKKNHLMFNLLEKPATKH